MVESSKPPVIRVEDVTRHYVMGDVVVKALRGVSLDIHYGEMLAIMGPSGSGKSTLMHLIGCLDTPTSGKLFIDETDVSGMNEKQLAGVRNRKIGFVFQQFNLLTKVNVLENVMTPLIYAGIHVKERRRRALEALDNVGLADRVKHRPSELSGGQRQRVAIARALVTDPSIILADEPTGALDTQTGDHILEIFQKINNAGKTIIMVTHDPEVNAFCRNSIHLRDGKVVDNVV